MIERGSRVVKSEQYWKIFRRKPGLRERVGTVIGLGIGYARVHWDGNAKSSIDYVSTSLLRSVDEGLDYVI